ncbi:MAG TPA: DNA repair protein RadA [Acidimicrobiales bacterium]|nr:DNA repair protein RadA [Acidimicrobiales bacterium]
MPRLRTVHRCHECGSAQPRWSGRCGACGAWNSLIEEVEATPAAASSRPAGLRSESAGPAVPITSVEGHDDRPLPTGLDELDRVLAGGLVPGSATLLGGEPGIGKSTLVLQALANLTAAGHRCLLVAAEESKAQVRMRAERLGAVGDSLWLVAATSLADVTAAVTELEPSVCVVDSIQALYDPALESAPGSVAQVRACAHELVGLAKGRGTSMVMIGHVTKEGALAGPRVLEHLVDTVLSFEGDRHHALRLLRAVKHRFGPVGELGLFEMTGAGLAPVADPSGMLLADRRFGVPGCVVLPAMEGSRPLLVELQSLATSTSLQMPRRSAQGLDGGRLSLMIAVLQRRAGLALGTYDVYASVVGGVRVTEPAADLALVLSLASVVRDQVVHPDLVVFGEVGLGGEVRQVVHTPRRLAEAFRLGFRRAIVAGSSADGPEGMSVYRVASVGQAIETMGRLRPGLRALPGPGGPT